MDNVEQWVDNEQIIGKQGVRRGSQSNLRYCNVTGRTEEKKKFFSE